MHAATPTTTCSYLLVALPLPPHALCPCPLSPLSFFAPNPPNMQADWAFAVRQVEESPSSTTLPELRLVDASGRVLVARDVALWRVDSLEDTPIGLAVLFKSWSYV